MVIFAQEFSRGRDFKHDIIFVAIDKETSSFPDIHGKTVTRQINSHLGLNKMTKNAFKCVNPKLIGGDAAMSTANYC
jgi:hypothetical protein